MSIDVCRCLLDMDIFHFINDDLMMVRGTFSPPQFLGFSNWGNMNLTAAQLIIFRLRKRGFHHLPLCSEMTCHYLHHHTGSLLRKTSALVEL